MRPNESSSSSPSILSSFLSPRGQSFSLFSPQKTDETDSSNPLPARWVDFFCIVGPQERIVSHVDSQLLSAKVLDSYPKSRKDMEFPDQLPLFCFPDGCKARKIKRKIAKGNAPEATLISIILTSSAGRRLYGSCLRLYEARPSEPRSSDSDSERPQQPPKKRPRTDSKATEKQPQPHEDFVYFFPKCLVLLSHHPFFSAQATILKELFFTIQSGTSPIPFERYIAHMVDDIPLPPKGMARVQWESWTGKNQKVLLQRPAPNELPLLNLSVKPLLRIVSVSNLLVIWAELLKEGRVVLCCAPENSSLLTPIAEVILSLLFPFEWQGIYVPVLPSDMKEVLEAPVPYILGVGLKPADLDHPVGVLLYDIDDDVLHLGWKDDGTEHDALPAFPESPIMRLKTDLEELADPLYLQPTLQTKKGRITSGDKSKELDNASREPYAQMTRLNGGPSPRSYILSQSCKVTKTSWSSPLQAEDYKLNKSFRPKETTQTMDGSQLASSQAEVMASNENSSSFANSLQRRSRMMQAHADRFMAVVAGSSYATPSSFAAQTNLDDILNQQDDIADNLFDLDVVFNFKVRQAFLKCLAKVLATYKNHVAKETGQLKTERFLQGLRLHSRCKEYVDAMVRSQMFEDFMNGEDGSSRRKVFNETISRLQNPTNPNKKGQTGFLESKEWSIQRSLVPPGPSSIGIRQGMVFNADKSFPDKLDPEECLTSESMPPLRALWDGALFGACCDFSIFESDPQPPHSSGQDHEETEGMIMKV